MNKEEKHIFKTAFNNGYFMQEHYPDLAQKLAEGVQHKMYREAFAAGILQYRQEQEQQLNQYLEQQRSVQRKVQNNSPVKKKQSNDRSLD